MKFRFFYRTPDANNGGGQFTPEQLKKLADMEITEVAVKAFNAAFPQMLKSGLTGEDASGAIKAIVTEALKGANITVKDSVDGAEKTLEALLKSFQDQHDALVKAFNEGKGGRQNKTGVYIDFVQKSVELYKRVEDNPQFNQNTTFKAAELMTTANIIGSPAVGGFSPLFGNYIDSEVGHVPKPENVILDLIDVRSQPGTENIYYSDMVPKEGDAAFIAEGSLKPLADATWVTSKAPVKEVALRWKFTTRLMNHAPSVVGDFLEHAVQLVDQKVDDAALSGTGVGNNLSGIAVAAGAFIVPTQLSKYYEKANIYDAIIAMATRIRLSNFKGQLTVVLNTVWRAKMKGIKDANGNYIIPPFATPDGETVDGVRVVFSNKILDTKILIGDLKHFKLVWAENVKYFEGYENDDFSKNLVSRKLEAFMGTYIKKSSAGAIIMDDIATVMTAIAKV